MITLAPDGRTAKGRWRIRAMLGGYGGSATWYSGVYENEYVLEGRAWKISVLHSESKATAAYTATGWKESGAHVPFHYTAASLTTPIPDLASRGVEAIGTAHPSLASLADRVDQLTRRTALLNDQAEVTNLQDTYGYAVDRKLWDQVADLFARDGTLELGLRGVYVGKVSIRHAFDQFGSQGLRGGERNDHVYLQTIVSVAPLTAGARRSERACWTWAASPEAAAIGPPEGLKASLFRNMAVGELEGQVRQQFGPHRIRVAGLELLKSSTKLA